MSYDLVIRNGRIVDGLGGEPFPGDVAVADGVIVGSALVRRVAEAAGKPRQDLLADVGHYAADLATACR